MSGDIDRYAEQWEANAQIDAHFSVLTDPDKVTDRWDPAAFYASGEMEIARLFDYMEAHGIEVARGACLDFGCGVGRLTRALAARFDRTLGIDIAPTMISLARKAAAEAEFAVNDTPDLSLVPSASIDFVQSNIVLQHMNNELQRAFLGEFCRVLASGGLAAVQCPSADLPMVGQGVRALLPEAAVAALKQMIRRTPEAPRWKRHIEMEMNCLAESAVAEVIDAAGCTIEHLIFTNATEADYGGRLVFLDRSAAQRRIYWRRARSPSPYLSALYFIRKPAAEADTNPQHPLDALSRRP